MSERVRIITIDIQDGLVITKFQPPVPESMTFEATSGALVIHKILHHKGSLAVGGVAYEMGSPRLLEEKLVSMQAELEANTGYELRAGIPQLVAEAAK